MNFPDHSFCDLTDQRAVVTGSSSGIGAAIARELARAGAQLLLHCSSSTRRADQLADEIARMGGSADVLTADFLDGDQRRRFGEDAWQRRDGVDIWINNAGVDLLTGDAASLPFDEKLDRLLQVDVASTIYFSKQIGRQMKARGQGVILNIGWDQADQGMEGDSGELFSAAKSAVMGFTKSLAVSLAPQVRVNCIAPGWIRTAWGRQASEAWQQRVLAETPLKRWGTPEDIARLARFLVSREADYITGQVINANGGAVR